MKYNNITKMTTAIAAQIQAANIPIATKLNESTDNEIQQTF